MRCLLVCNGLHPPCLVSQHSCPCTLTSHPGTGWLFFKEGLPVPEALNLNLIEEQMEIIHRSEQQNLKMNWAHGGIHLAGYLLFSLLVAFQGKVHIVRHLHTVGIKLCYTKKKKKGLWGKDTRDWGVEISQST